MNEPFEQTIKLGHPRAMHHARRERIATVILASLAERIYVGKSLEPFTGPHVQVALMLTDELIKALDEAFENETVQR